MRTEHPLTKLNLSRMPIVMDGPVLKIVSGRSQTQNGLADASTSGVSSVFSALSNAVDLLPHDEIGLHQVLIVRRAIARQASVRSRWFGGRIYNRFAGEYPNYIPLSGTHLKQALSVCNLKAPEFVVPSGEYQLRLDYVEGAIDALSQRLNPQK